MAFWQAFVAWLEYYRHRVFEQSLTGASMFAVLSNFVEALLISFIVISLLMPLSHRFGWLDKPDARKQHELPTPAIGGIGVFLGIVVPAVMTYGLDQATLSFALGGLLLVVVGALDDRFHIDWKARLGVQLLATVVMIYGAGARAEHVGPLFGFGDIELGELSVPVTIFITLALINVLNMFDGLDGLIGLVTLAVTAMFVCAAVYSGAYDIALALVWVLGALTGFLWFNLRRPGQAKARVFLGDTGSSFIGYLLAFVIFRLTQNPVHPVSPILGPYLMLPPIIDGLVVIVHRARRGVSPFSAGRDHAHHLLQDAGFSVTQIVALMTVLTLVSGLFGALGMLLDVPEPALVMFYVVATLAWYWITGDRERALACLGWLHKKVTSRTSLQQHPSSN
jgi:UDP-GlcNAc:undecaprenyl-phosphate GlcNAc-1-phosphate transferase